MISAVVLAAGESRRMGEPKLLLPFGRSTVIGTVLDHVLESEVDRILVVLGAEEAKIREAVGERPVTMVTNIGYREGMLSSIQAGFRALPAGTTAAVVCLGDQPLIPPAVIDALIHAHRDTGKGLVLPTFKGKRGHPVLVSTAYREEIMSLDPLTGLRPLFHTHPSDTLEVEVGTPDILKDMDRPGDYARQRKTDKERKT